EAGKCVTPCGDGVRDPGEQCDGADVGGGSCQSQGWSGGTLGCTGTCTFDESGCEDGGTVCGNGVQEAGEACDSGDLDGKDCGDFGFSDGGLACTGGCQFDTSG